MPVRLPRWTRRAKLLQLRRRRWPYCLEDDIYDESQGLVFSFATDLTLFENVDLLSSMMHAAIVEAVAPPGDFNLDGQVDGEDFLRWQRGVPANSLSPDDLAAWEANFGSTGNLAAASIAVPEPSTTLLVSAGIMAVLICSAHMCVWVLR